MAKIGPCYHVGSLPEIVRKICLHLMEYLRADCFVAFVMGMESEREEPIAYQGLTAAELEHVELMFAGHLCLDLQCGQTQVGRLLFLSRTTTPRKGYSLELIQVIVDRLADTVSRLRTEHRLRDHADFLTAVLDTAHDAIISIDQKGTIIVANSATKNLFGYDPKELLGKNVRILMPAPFCDEHDHYIKTYLETGKAKIIGFGRETVAKRKDGSLFPIDLAVSQVDHSPRFTGIVRDISERKHLESHVLQIATDEQQRIGQELHDVTGQELTGLSLLAGALVERLDEQTQTREGVSSSPIPADIRATAGRLLDGLTKANEHVHQLSHGIMPVQIDSEGLRAALEELAQSTTCPGKLVCLFSSISTPQLDDTLTATQLYRIAQEAVSNAVRHGGSSLIQISLDQTDSHIVLLIRDNGIGFDVDSPRRPRGADSGMGLRIMRYRAGLVGGELQVLRHGRGAGSMLSPKETQLRCQP